MNILNRYISRGRRTAFRVFDGVAIILLMPRNSSDTSDTAYELSPAGTFIWQLLEKDMKGSVLVGRMMKPLALVRKEAIRELTAFITVLSREGLVEIARKPGPKGKPWLA